MIDLPILVWLMIALWVVFGLVITLFIKAFYRKPQPGHVLVVTTMKDELRITFTGTVVIPVLHRCFELDVRDRVLSVNGQDLLLGFDHSSATIEVLTKKIGGHDLAATNALLKALVATHTPDELQALGLSVRTVGQTAPMLPRSDGEADEASQQPAPAD